MKNASDARNQGRCIWCGNESPDGHLEHVIPKAVGCSDEFVLPSSVVCVACNNGLAYLDRALADEFDFLALFAGVRGRKNKRVVVRSRSNARGTIVAGTPHLSFNMNPFSVDAHDGTTLSGYRGRSRDVKSAIRNENGVSKLSFSVKVGATPNFTRATFKVGLSLLAYILGADLARSRKFDPVRRFVRHGEGERHVMLCPADDKKYISGKPSAHVSDTGDYVAEFRVGPIWFLVDLSDGEAYMSRMVELMLRTYGRSGWAILPIDGALGKRAATYTPTFGELYRR